MMIVKDTIPAAIALGVLSGFLLVRLLPWPSVSVPKFVI
jgi:hypothetical protein